MSRQRKSPTQIAIENLIFIPTRKSRTKTRPMPAASEVKTFDYTSGLLRAKLNRMRFTR